MTSRINFTVGPAADRNTSPVPTTRPRFSPRRAISGRYVTARNVSFWLFVSVCSGSALAVFLLFPR